MSFEGRSRSRSSGLGAPPTHLQCGAHVLTSLLRLQIAQPEGTAGQNRPEHDRSPGDAKI
jgi:hypothetical protein